MNAANVLHQVPGKATSVSKLATTGLKDNGRYNLDLCLLNPLLLKHHHLSVC